MLRKYFALLAVLPALVAAAPRAPTIRDAANGPGWVAKESDDGLAVYTRPLPGSRVREVKAVKVIAAPVARVWAAVTDYAHYSDFMPYTTESRIIARGAAGILFYGVVDAPLVSKRDYLIRVRLHPDDHGTWWNEWRPEQAASVPPRDGLVRVAVNTGGWILTPVDAAHTRATYYLLTDPGGSIPGWIANRANTVALPKLFRRVERRANQN